MTTSEILNSPKEDVLKAMIEEIRGSKIFKGSEEELEKIAEKKYRRVFHLHNSVIQWWKLVKTDNNNFMLLSHNSNEVILLKFTGEIVYTDSLTHRKNAYYYAKRLKAITYYMCSRKKAIDNVLQLNFTWPSENPPREVLMKLSIPMRPKPRPRVIKKVVKKRDQR